jgi:hypothetical protein
MKRKRRFVVLLGMALAAGLFLAGCDLTTNPSNKGKSGDGSGTGNTESKVIRITGFRETAYFNGAVYNGRLAMVTLHPSTVSESIVAGGMTMLETTDSVDLTFDLYDPDFETRWTGTGEYIVVLMVIDA